MAEVRNMVVTKAGYEYIGHFRRGQLRIVLESPHSGCTVYPKEEFEFVKLFLVFGIDSEDGVPMESIKHKPCRVIFDENGKAVRLQHIVEDRIMWEVR
jgi:hypothetical protein